MDIITGSDAWVIAEDAPEDDEEEAVDHELKPTNSARRVKALVEQVTGARASCGGSPAFQAHMLT